MTREEFSVLSAIAENQEFIREEFNDTQQSLIHKGLLKTGGNGITAAGLQALEPYRVKRAVFLAAGFGSRMVPITINTPKPMVRVHGKRIIETLLDAVLAVDIQEIHIVRGYLGEEFELLKTKYPMIQFIENPEYNGTGTISSFYHAKDLLKNAYVLESDLVVQNSGVIRKYHYTSDFLGTRMQETDDWYFKTKPDGKICEIGVGGSGNNLYKLIGISYWDGEAGRRLATDIAEAYHSTEGKKLPMSFIPFRVYPDRYDVSIMPCKETDVVEIDSFAELQEYDEAYKTT